MMQLRQCIQKRLRVYMHGHNQVGAVFLRISGPLSMVLLCVTGKGLVRRAMSGWSGSGSPRPSGELVPFKDFNPIALQCQVGQLMHWSKLSRSCSQLELFKKHLVCEFHVHRPTTRISANKVGGCVGGSRSFPRQRSRAECWILELADHLWRCHGGRPQLLPPDAEQGGCPPLPWWRARGRQARPAYSAGIRFSC